MTDTTTISAEEMIQLRIEKIIGDISGREFVPVSEMVDELLDLRRMVTPCQ